MSAEQTDENIDQLPAVAKNIYLPCKKCDENRYHRVLAHKSKNSAKLECEICSGKKTFTLKKARKKATGAKKKTATKRVKKNSFAALLTDIGTEGTVPYSMKSKFDEKAAIDHSKFGLGFVTESTALKVQVVFEDATRELVHNRGN